jgi:hypothetical protein
MNGTIAGTSFHTYTIVPDGDLTITLLKSERIEPPPEEGPKWQKHIVAKFIVKRSTLLELPAEDERFDTFFHNMFGGPFKEANKNHVNIEEQDLDALKIFLYVAHERADLESTYQVDHKAMWYLAQLLDFCNISVKMFESWFANWYESKGDNGIDLISPQEMLLPCHKFNHAPGFLKATKECVYGLPHTVFEINPTDCHVVHLPPRIIRKSCLLL